MINILKNLLPFENKWAGAGGTPFGSAPGDSVAMADWNPQLSLIGWP